MKKLILSLFILILLTGCVCIESAGVDEIVKSALQSKYSLYNHVNRGYKYYLPRELTVSESEYRNEVLKSKYYDYYLYVDLVRYNKKVTEKVEEKNNLYYSKLFEHDGKVGALHIKEIESDDYLIFASYHYASIEVRVRKRDINSAVANIMVILSSIQYNDKVIENLLKEDKLNSTEESVDVFDDDLKREDYLDVGNHEEEDSSYYDPDIIN